MWHVFKITVTVVWSMEQFGSWNALYIILFHYFFAEYYQNVSFPDSFGFPTSHFFLLSAILFIVYFIFCHRHKSISEHWILCSFKVLCSVMWILSNLATHALRVFIVAPCILKSISFTHQQMHYLLNLERFKIYIKIHRNYRSYMFWCMTIIRELILNLAKVMFIWKYLVKLCRMWVGDVAAHLQ
jgi:hypothetical protein